MTRFAPAAILAVGCLLVSGIREQKQVPPRMKIAQMQLAFPGFKAEDRTIADDERRVAGMSDYVLRMFQRDSLDPGFSVYVGYYDFQVQGKSIHSPKNCLPGAGWEALAATVQPVEVGGAEHRVNRYLLTNKNQQALVYYWYQGRGRIEANEYKVKYNLMRDAALYGRTEEALVRIVVPIDTRTLKTPATAIDYAASDSLAVRVARALIPAVSQALPLPPAS